MLLKVTCASVDIERYIEYYETNGFELVQKTHENGEVDLLFRGVSSSHSANYVPTDPSAKAYLEFSDGSVSPLHIRRERNFFEDD